MYYANFRTNLGTSLSKPLEGKNLRLLKSDIIDIAKGNTFQDPLNTTSVWIEDENQNEVYRAVVHVSKERNYYVRCCDNK